MKIHFLKITVSIGNSSEEPYEWMDFTLRSTGNMGFRLWGLRKFMTMLQFRRNFVTGWLHRIRPFVCFRVGKRKYLFWGIRLSSRVEVTGRSHFFVLINLAVGLVDIFPILEWITVLNEVLVNNGIIRLGSLPSLIQIFIFLFHYLSVFIGLMLHRKVVVLHIIFGAFLHLG